MTADRLKVAAGLLLTSPFVPMLFQGEEWGASTPWQYFTDFADRDLGRAVTEGRRSEFASFGWDPGQVPDPQDPATFQRSKLDWEELDKEVHADLLEWHRGLLRLRREQADLTDPRLERTSSAADATVSGVVVTRGWILVAALIGPAPAGLAVGVGGRLLAASTPEARLEEGRLRLVPDSVAVMELPVGDAGEERHGRRTATPPPTELASTFEWTLDRAGQA
jgi:maltooligosyltrehalose trehalohydrolase